MRTLRGIALLLLCLIPIASLVHRDDLGRWDVQRSAMSAPDEFSYLLMAQHFLEGGGFSLQSTLGRDTYFPPGYPLLLAAWGKCFGLTTFTAHALNTLLLCVDTFLVYFLARRLLLAMAMPGDRQGLSPSAAGNLAMVITAIFATNWHVLETSLLIMSEPAFMLVLFVWLMVTLRWEDWYQHAGKAAVVGLLAVAAWSVRGAGIVCVATTIFYPFYVWLRQRRAREETAATLKILPVVILFLLPVIYQLILMVSSPEKSITAGRESANSYPKQFLNGLLGENVFFMILSHLDDYAASFVPWFRENPDYHFRDAIGKIFGILGLLGWLAHLLGAMNMRGMRRDDALKAERKPQTRVGQNHVLEIFILGYVVLYLLWPFNFPRFWSPILPVMLAYAADTVMRFGFDGRKTPRPAIAGALLALLMVLTAEEAALQLGNYARRLNFVSDSIREGVRAVERASPDPDHTMITGLGDDELYAFAWYASQEPDRHVVSLRVPEPHNPKTGKRERAHEMLLRTFNELPAQQGNAPTGSPPIASHFYFVSYFPGSDTRSALEELERQSKDAQVKVIFRKERVLTIWDIQRKPSE